MKKILVSIVCIYYYVVVCKLVVYIHNEQLFYKLHEWFTSASTEIKTVSIPFIVIFGFFGIILSVVGMFGPFLGWMNFLLSSPYDAAINSRVYSHYGHYCGSADAAATAIKIADSIGKKCSYCGSSTKKILEKHCKNCGASF